MLQHNIKVFFIHGEGAFAVTPLCEFGGDKGFVGALFFLYNVVHRRERFQRIIGIKACQKLVGFACNFF